MNNNVLDSREIARIMEWKRKLENYRKHNTVDHIKVNLETSGYNVILSKNKEVLKPEGKVEIQLDDWIQGNYNKITNEIEYKVSFPMTYIGSPNEAEIGTTFYNKECNSKEFESNVEINEIITKSMELLNKEVLVAEDFLGMRGYGEIVHFIDDYGKRYSKLINIELYKNEYKIHSEPPKKKALEKRYNELTENDEVEIIKELNININTPMGDSKKSIVNSFCNRYIWEEYFMYRGYSFACIEADVKYDYSKVNGIDDVIKSLDLKPKYVDYLYSSYIIKFCPNERFHFKSWVDYLKLLISFVEYLETISIEGVDISFREFWHDTPEFIQIDRNAEVLENIIFDKERFSFNGNTHF
ncbi:hypothetical protein KWV42_10390 [Clostridioides difficile]|uniref:hypothetical protein n=1 Tax=Clostridioides difficile TaxID=1496 RepID=UPI0010B800DF|nr:hypothetical protein [Clostridioides difficile]MBY1883494.1 hypothetical protein [Clostridioides difficile]MBZ0781387.1 hypothetical protein [Clostridioides difficile]MBZ0855031.1 hypothetical protein [Clostridioides difficile]MCG7701619.1 hypothetical protein [Clostridioides difficile]